MMRVNAMTSNKVEVRDLCCQMKRSDRKTKSGEYEAEAISKSQAEGRDIKCGGPHGSKQSLCKNNVDFTQQPLNAS